MAELKDTELSKVNGGMTISEIKDAYNSLWGKVPSEIRSSIIEALETKGSKAAFALGEKLLKDMDWALPMLDYLKNVN